MVVVVLVVRLNGMPECIHCQSTGVSVVVVVRLNGKILNFVKVLHQRMFACLMLLSLQCFDTVVLASKKHLACKNGVVICMELDANDLLIVRLKLLPSHHILLL